MFHRNQRFRLPLIVGTLFYAASVLAAASEAAGDSGETIDEVLVSGKRLRELRDAVIKSEDRLVARYNAVNKDRDLDIECFKHTPTGTRFSYRYCRLRMQERAQSKDASELMNFMRNLDISNGAAPPLRETGVKLLERWPDYRKNLAKLLEEDEELRELVTLQAQALWDYEAAQQRRPRTRNASAD